MQEQVYEYFNNYFDGQLNESTSDEDIMEAVYDLIDLCEAVCDMVEERPSIEKRARQATQASNTRWHDRQWDEEEYASGPRKRKTYGGTRTQAQHKALDKKAKARTKTAIKNLKKSIEAKLVQGGTPRRKAKTQARISASDKIDKWEDQSQAARAKSQGRSHGGNYTDKWESDFDDPDDV
jgi:hypothetical protein